jgi:sialidase-1
MRLLLACLLGIVVSCAPAPTTEDSGPSVYRTDVFQAGADGYPSYRIPSIVTTPSGALLAFAEGRMRNNDHAENDIVLRRSEDGGQTWDAMHTIAEDGPNCLNNPQAVVLPGSGRILLLYQVFPKNLHARSIGDDIGVASPGITGPKVQISLLIHSDDDGLTWSEPRDVTAGVKRPEGAVGHAGGPGIGILMRRGEHAGRILMPFNETVYEGGSLDPKDRIFHVYAAYSDDDGETWQYGEDAPHDQSLPGQNGWGNEVQMVELADGTVLLNSRGYAGNKLRKTAISADGGLTWSALRDHPELPEPMCMGSLLRYGDPLDGEPSILLFSSPADTENRALGTVRMSRDEGKTWPVSKLLAPEGQFAYSVLTRLADGSIGCLYETGDYGRIVFARFDLAWLETE